MTSPSDGPNPSGVCRCGCGQKTKIAPKTITSLGWVKGAPISYVKGHNNRKRAMVGPGPNPSGLCMCGCGEKTSLASQSHTAKGWIKGQPLRYVPGHEHRLSPFDYIVDSVTGCWEWQRAKDPKGYGRMRYPETGRTILAHRYYYEQKYGPIPEGLFACHTCDNPGCVNPEHHFLGTIADNNADMMAKGRHASQRKEVA